MEAASNPTIAAVYPTEKIRRLNILPAWWPAGIVIGGLPGAAIAGSGLPWQANLIILIVPSVLLAYLATTTMFPVTERVATGVSYPEMFRELRVHPIFFVWFFAMMLTTASEFAPGQLVDVVLSRIVGMHGIYILVYVSGLMFVMRHFAGVLSKRLSALGVLFAGGILAMFGLYGLSLAHAPIPALAAATIWGLGVCFMYPTMVAAVAERFRRGGALFMGLTRFAGGISVQLVSPQLGSIFDREKIRAAGGLAQLSALTPEQLDPALRYASAQTFRVLVLIPVALLPLFALLWRRER